MNKKAGYLLISLLAVRISAASEPLPQQAPAAGTPLTLADAVRLAIAHAPDVSLADAQGQKAADALRESRATNLPQVVAGTGLAYNNGFPLSIEGSAPSIFQVGMTQSMFNKRNKNLILEAQEDIKSTRVGAESA
jgi:outer membrane protein TolC